MQGPCRSLQNINMNTWLDVGNNRIWETKSVKMLGILIDNSLKFDNYVAEICRKASRKLSLSPVN